ncbi:hybrid sensor histidine kinase/response regulator [Sesbania bispinosa]|nr:hybrid sensor histidine kinase/response regulator [Sesbania bispinosa]
MPQDIDLNATFSDIDVDEAPLSKRTMVPSGVGVYDIQFDLNQPHAMMFKMKQTELIYVFMIMDIRGRDRGTYFQKA